MPPQYACDRCGSTEFYEEDGKWYCENGDEQEGGQQVGEDDGDFARAGKVRRQKEVKEKQKVLKAYRGAKGFQLFLKAWQYVLWRQCHALIHNHGLPAELWTLVRELWALRLSRLAERLIENEDSNPPIAPISAANSESGEDFDGDQFDLKTLKGSKRIIDNPSLADTISLAYLGILILRHPTSLASIYKYIREEKVCYIRAVRYVPQGIKDHLAPEYHFALDTITIPTEHDLQLSVYRSAMMYGDEFDMIIPPLNWRLMLMENLKCLALPLEIFAMVKFLASVLDFNFSYPQKHTQRRNATTFPETQLMALIIVATKLIFPFDSDTAKRYPRTINEPSATKMNWNAWLVARKQQEDVDTEIDTISPSRAIEVTDTDVLRMSESQLDSYMDWFQQTYAKDFKANSLRQQILDMFPVQKVEPKRTNTSVDESGQTHATSRLKSTQAELKPRRAVADEDQASLGDSVWLRPGERYQKYQSLNSMPESAIYFHKDAATLACLNIDTLLRACLRVERLLLRHQHEQRRAEYFADEL